MGDTCGDRSGGKGRASGTEEWWGADGRGEKRPGCRTSVLNRAWREKIKGHHWRIDGSK